MRFCLIFILFCFLNSFLFSQRRLDLSLYKLIWADGFDYANAEELYKAGKWKAGFPYNDLRGSEQNYNQLNCSEIATNDYLSVSNGVLKMSAYTDYSKYIDSVYYENKYWRTQRESSILTAVYDSDYPCFQGGATWLAGFSYGIFEARIKLPAVSGDYPAFWLWGDSYQPCTNGASIYSCLPASRADTLPCPTQGFCPGFEIDIFEAKYTQESWWSSPEQHFWLTNQANGYQNPACFPCATNYRFDNTNPQDNYHIYSLAWTPDSISWFIDGNEIRTQFTGSPRAKLNLILSFSSYANGNSGTMWVDYVKIYRPANQNYDFLHQNSQKNNFIWAVPDTNLSNFKNYYHSFRQNSYFKANYKYFSAGFNSRTAQHFNQAVYYEPQIGKNNRLIYNLIADNGKKDNLIRSLQLYNIGNYPVFTSILDTLAADADNSCNFVMDTSQNNEVFLYYKNINGGINQLSIADDNKKTVKNLPVSNGIKLNVSNNLIYIQQKTAKNSFFAYRSEQNQLCFLLFDSLKNGYYLQKTNIQNFKDNLIYHQNGFLYYIGTDNQIYTANINFANLYQDVKDKNINLSVSKLAYIVPQTTENEVKNNRKNKKIKPFIKNLTFCPAQKQLFYLNEAQQIISIKLENMQITVFDLTDAFAGLQVRYIQNDSSKGLELFYVTDNKKIKTLYQRTTAEGKTEQFINSTLDIFTAEGDYRVGNVFALSQKTARVFVLNAHRRAISFYDLRTDNHLPALFYDCNNDDTFRVGLQF